MGAQYAPVGTVLHIPSLWALFLAISVHTIRVYAYSYAKWDDFIQEYHNINIRD